MPAHANAAKKELVALAASPNAADHQALIVRLSEPKTGALFRADLDAARGKRAPRCGLGAPAFGVIGICKGDLSGNGALEILCALATNPQPSALERFADVGAIKAFAPDTDLGDLLIKTSSAISAPTPRIVALWRRHFVPGSGAANLMPAILLDNGTAPALALFSESLASKRFLVEDRVGWLNAIAVRRTRAPILGLAKTLLGSPLPAALHRELVRAVFSNEVYMSGPPPSFSKAEPAVRTELKAVAEKALALDLPKALRAQVTKTIEELKD